MTATGMNIWVETAIVLVIAAGLAYVFTGAVGASNTTQDKQGVWETLGNKTDLCYSLGDDLEGWTCLKEVRDTQRDNDLISEEEYFEFLEIYRRNASDLVASR